MYSFENLDVYFIGFGENAVINGQDVQVIFSDYHEPMLTGTAEGRRITATAKTYVVENVPMDTLTTVRGKDYSIRERELVLPDGAFTKLILEEV
jgi:hypothetical protein